MLRFDRKISDDIDASRSQTIHPNITVVVALHNAHSVPNHKREVV